MPSLSEKGILIPPSPIRKLVPFSEEAKRKGKKVYHLNIGQPDISTPAIALDALRNLDLRVIEYGHSAGNESYRQKLAEYYKKAGINIDHTQMLITTGASEAILFAFLPVLIPGKKLLPLNHSMPIIVVLPLLPG